MLNISRRKRAKSQISTLSGKWYCNNQLQDSIGTMIDVFDSSTGDAISVTPDCTKSEVDVAVLGAQRAFHEWSTSEGTYRANLLRQAAELIRNESETLSLMLALETGKALKTECEGEVQLIASILDYFGNFGTELKGRTVPFSRDVLAWTMREPIGVVAGIVPWNMPLMFLAYKIAAPLICGNTVVIKAPELAPFTILKICSLIGPLFPKNVISVVVGRGNSTGQALIENDNIKKISFTGSVESGRAVYTSAARKLKQVNLELGGKSPMLVLPDCDIDVAVDGAIAGIRFTRQAQSCTSTTRVYIHNTMIDEFVQLIVKRSALLEIGDPLSDDTQTGSIISHEQLDNIRSMIDRARSTGLEPIVAGLVPEGPELSNGAFIEPHFFINPPHQSEIVQKEIFGPVMCIHSWSEEDELVKLANSVEYGLSASVWGRDITMCMKIAQRMEVGFVQINQNAVMLPGLSYAGTKSSGFGSETSLESMLASFTREKTTIVNLAQ